MLEQVSKVFRAETGPVEALRELSLQLERGRIVGIFGNNGAGKTTLTRIIAGLIEPTQGSVRIAGAPPGGVRIGLVGSDERSFYARLCVRENLACFGRLQGLSRGEAESRTRAWAGRLCFEALLERPFQTLSAGEKQRVNLARGLLARPELLILDEATRQADPATVLLVRGLLRELATREGVLVLYTGQEFQGVEEDCDEIVLLDRGRARLAGPAREVLSRSAPAAWHLRFADAAARAHALARWPGLEPGAEEDAALWPAAQPSQLPAELPALARELGPQLRALEWRAEPSVRELLLRLSAGGLRAADTALERSAATPQPGAAAATLRGASTLALVATLVRRDRLIELSFRFELVLRFALVAVWGVLFWFFSRLVDAHDPRLSGQPFGFLLFGLAALQISQTCLLRMGQRLREEQLAGTLEPLVATGAPTARLLLGSLAWPLGTLLAGLLVLFVLAVGVGGLSLAQADPLALALVLALGCAALAALGLASAAFVLGFQRGDPVAALLNLASLVLAGAYSPREFLPDWLEWLRDPAAHAAARRPARRGLLRGRLRRRAVPACAARARWPCRRWSACRSRCWPCVWRSRVRGAWAACATPERAQAS